MKKFKCSDLGIDCKWEIQHESEQEILRQAEQHGREKHGLLQINDKLRNKIRSKILDIRAA